METAGHYFQSLLLDAMNQPFGMSQKAALALWLLGVCVGMFMYVYEGKSRMTEALLIGPTVFFFLVFYRTPSTGAVWKFGLREYNQNAVAVATEDFRTAPTVGSASTPANVSWFFSLYNRLTSGVINAFVSTIELISQKGDLTFVTKAEKYEALFRPQIQDSSLRYFVSGIMIPHCTDYFLLTREYLDPATNVLRRNTVQEALTARGKAATVTRADHPEIFEWLDKRNFAREAGADRLSCDELWQAGISLLRPESAKYIDEIVSQQVPEGLTSEELRAKLEEKFSNRYVSPDGLQVQEMNSDQRAMLMINEVAGRMLANELQRNSPELLGVEFGPDTPIRDGGMVFTEKDAPRQLRRIYKEDEGREKGDFLMAMLALPYVQGAVLLFLAITFPLAAITWVIPGRHGGFFIWLALWLWVKSWDAGFAVVMLIDSIIYQLLPHGPPISSTVLETPWTALKSLMMVDPSYSVYTYYHILAVCLGSVPLITGLLVKKAAGELGGTLRDSLTTFSGRIGGAIAAYYQATSAQTSLRQSIMDSVGQAKRALNAARFDPVVQNARQNYERAMKDAKALRYKGAPGMAQLAESAAMSHANILKARMGYLMQTGLTAAYGAPATKQQAIDMIVDNFNSHDPISRVWNAEAQLGYEAAFLNSNVTAAVNPVFAEGLERTLAYQKPAFDTGFQSIGNVTELMANLGKDWNLEKLGEAVTRAQNGDLAAPSNTPLNHYVMMNYIEPSDVVKERRRSKP